MGDIVMHKLYSQATPPRQRVNSAQRDSVALRHRMAHIVCNRVQRPEGLSKRLEAHLPWYDGLVSILREELLTQTFNNCTLLVVKWNFSLAKEASITWADKRKSSREARQVVEQIWAR